MALVLSKSKLSSTENALIDAQPQVLQPHDLIGGLMAVQLNKVKAQGRCCR